MNNSSGYDAVKDGGRYGPLPHWIVGFPGLIWQIELPASRLSVIKNWHHPELGRDTSLLLKDRSFRKIMVMREDLLAFEAFWDIMLGRESAAMSFRLKSQPERPLYLQGWAHPQDSGIYCGSMMYDYTREVVDSENGLYAGTHIHRARHPVFVINTDKRVIQRYNKAAGSIFETKNSPILHINDISPKGQSDKLLEAAKSALENDVWGGVLSFSGLGLSSFNARVRIVNCSNDNANMVRISFIDQPRIALQESISAQSSLSTKLVELVRACPDLRSALRALLDHAELPALNGLMFSDIISEKGKVQVYGVGELEKHMGWGELHDYEGTIAQSIERFNLRSLLVDECLDSTKAIDWVLFIPRGVRSYFAKPFFEGTSLRSVLILCSFEPYSFPPDSEDYFTNLYEPFVQVVEAWRKNKK